MRWLTIITSLVLCTCVGKAFGTLSHSSLSSTTGKWIYQAELVLSQKLTVNPRDLHDTELGIQLERSLPEVKCFRRGVLTLRHPERSSRLELAILDGRIVDASNNCSDLLPNKVSVTLEGEIWSEDLAGRHVVGSIREGDSLSADRAQHLNSHLEALGVNVSDILRSEGNAARSSYLAFVNPRPNRKPLTNLDSLPDAAQRHAQQVMLLHREFKARISAYIRSSDRSIARDNAPHPLTIVLDNVRSVLNVGTIYRTAETAGIRELITCGITPHPPHDKLSKTALSAIENVPSRHFDSVKQAIDTLRSEGCVIVSLETTTRSRNYTSYQFKQPTAIIVGNEVSGVDSQALETSDALLEIPVFGRKNSLNVAAASAVAMFEVVRQWTECTSSRRGLGQGQGDSSFG